MVILLGLEEKALIKVTGARHGRGLPPKCQHSGQDSNDLQHFGKDAPTRYGGRNPQSQQWYQQQQQSFQKSRKGKDKKSYNQQEWNKR